MSYIEIMQALKNGFKVYWINTGYIVSHAHNGLYITFERNSYYSKLQESEYKDCFVGDKYAQD